MLIKHKEILEKYFPQYDYSWDSSQEPARKSYVGFLTIYKKELEPKITFPILGAPDTMDNEARIITLEFNDFYLTQVYTPNAGSGLNRLALRQIWDEKFANIIKLILNQK